MSAGTGAGAGTGWGFGGSVGAAGSGAVQNPQARPSGNLSSFAQTIGGSQSQAPLDLS